MAEPMLISGVTEHCPRCLGRGYWFGAITTIRIHCGRCNGVGFVRVIDGEVAP